VNVPLDLIRKVPLLAGLSDDELTHLISEAKQVELDPGQLLITEGSAPDALYLVIEGEAEVSKRQGNTEIVVAGLGPGDAVGEMSLLEQVPRSASVRSRTRLLALEISERSFFDLLQRPAAAISVIHTVTNRLHNNEAMLRQSAKMAGLGAIAAGLTHELNNPAAAVGRASRQLRDLLGEWVRLANQMPPEVRIAKPPTPPQPDPLGDRQAELETWLAELGVEKPWETSAALIGAGWEREAIADIIEGKPDPAATASFLGVGALVSSLIDELVTGSARISELVAAVKTYSYLDRAPIGDVDLHQGIDNTLVILRHKLGRGIKIRKEYAQDLGRIQGYPGELNQVWTNLIDNAIDAMGAEGELVITTRREGDLVTVEVCDTGPGIPGEVQARIFEPFFTTKPVGKGTGLGLATAYNAVVVKHRGNLTVESVPGRTCFRVELPTA